MKIKVRYIEEIAVLEIEGKININSSKLIESVGSLLDEGVHKIIIDMQRVDFVDYNGLSVLAITYKNALNNKGEMKICGISLHILELLRVVKLDEVFDIYADIEEAIESFKHKKKPSKQEILEQPLRRRFTRLDMDIPVNYKMIKGNLRRGENQLYAGRMANISGAGMFIRSIHILPPGSEVSLQVNFEKGKKDKFMEGVVMWLADKGLQPDLYPGMGVAFSNLSSAAQEKIIEFIERHATHRKGY